MAPPLISSPEKAEVMEAGLTFRLKQRSGKPAFLLNLKVVPPCLFKLQITPVKTKYLGPLHFTYID